MRTRRSRSLPCVRCGGFEARAWRPSHLNHRDPQPDRRPQPPLAVPAYQACRRPTRADPKVTLIALRSLRGFRGSGLAALAPQSPVSRQRPQARARRTRVAACRRMTRADPRAVLIALGSLPGFRGSGLAALTPQPPGTREATAATARRTRVSSLSAAEPSRPEGHAHCPAYAAGVSRLGPGGPHASTTGDPGGDRSHCSPYPRIQPVGGRAQPTRRSRSLPCLRCGGFEARAWRPSHLNHRMAATHWAPRTSTTGCPRTSTTGQCSHGVSRRRIAASR